MPVLRDLGARGAVFEWAYAPSNAPGRSLASIATGTAPNRVRGTDVGAALQLDPRHVVLAERLRAAGYDTAGFVCCRAFWDRTGLERGLAHVVVDPSGLALARAANAWLAERVARRDRPPLFVWMHVLEPRDWPTANPGIPVGPLDRRRYLKALEDADAALRELLRGFADQPAARAPIVLVTADHGEGLGDHGEQFHGTDLYEGQTHVPLVIAGPGIPARRIAETVGLVDLVPTIVDLAGYHPPSGPSIDGHSVADLATGRRPLAAETGTAFVTMPGASALVQGAWKYIERGVDQELYDVRADPGEHSNQISVRLDVANRLRRTLDSKHAAARASPF
jgi:arylsulfatase A-like enzyme